MSTENIETVIEKKVGTDESSNEEKKVTINEDNNEEKIIENREDIGNVVVNRQICIGLLRLMDTLISRGVYKPIEVLNVGRVYSNYMSQINLEEELNEYKIKLDSLNNIRILIELAISRGGFTGLELSSVGELYNILLSLLN